MQYAQEIREAVVRSALAGEMSQEAIAKRYGVSRSSVQQWARAARREGGARRVEAEKRPQDWSAEERFAALIETAGMSEEERGVWCRAHGLHSHQLATWRRDALAGSLGGTGRSEQTELNRLRQEAARLKKELARKDRALAETTAIRDAQPAGASFPDTDGPKPSLPPARRRRGRPATSGSSIPGRKVAMAHLSYAALLSVCVPFRKKHEFQDSR